MLHKTLTLLPKKDKIKNKETLLETLELIRDELDERIEENKKVISIINLFIDKLANNKITLDDYSNIRNEFIRTDKIKLNRLIDSYIYILEHDENKIEKDTNYFINKNNLNVLEDRCVLIRYNETRPIIYRNYTKNMNYLEIFNFIRYVDSIFSHFINKIIELYQYDLLDININDNIYNDILVLFENKLGYLKEYELTSKIYMIYEKDLLKYIKNYASEKFRRQKSKEFDEKAMYFKKSAQMTLAKKAKENLKYGYTTRNYIGD